MHYKNQPQEGEWRKVAEEQWWWHNWEWCDSICVETESSSGSLQEGARQVDLAAPVRTPIATQCCRRKPSRSKKTFPIIRIFLHWWRWCWALAVVILPCWPPYAAHGRLPTSQRAVQPQNPLCAKSQWKKSLRARSDILVKCKEQGGHRCSDGRRWDITEPWRCQGRQHLSNIINL